MLKVERVVQRTKKAENSPRSLLLSKVGKDGQSSERCLDERRYLQKLSCKSNESRHENDLEEVSRPSRKRGREKVNGKVRLLRNVAEF